MKRLTVLHLVASLRAGVVLAQSSAGYKIEESVFNQGGHPEQGDVLVADSGTDVIKVLVMHR